MEGRPQCGSQGPVQQNKGWRKEFLCDSLGKDMSEWESLADGAFEPRQLRTVKSSWRTQIPELYSRYSHKKSKSHKGEKIIEMYFYLDPDFPCLWGCNFHLLNREWFAQGPGNSSFAPDNLEATERIMLQGRFTFDKKPGTVVVQSPKPELHNMCLCTLQHTLLELYNCPVLFPGGLAGWVGCGGRAETWEYSAVCEAKQCSVNTGFV